MIAGILATKERLWNQNLLSATQRGYTHSCRMFVVVQWHKWAYSYVRSWVAHVATGSLDPTHTRLPHACAKAVINFMCYFLVSVLFFVLCTFHTLSTSFPCFTTCQPHSRTIDCFTQNQYDIESCNVSYVQLHAPDLWYGRQIDAATA